MLDEKTKRRNQLSKRCDQLFKLGLMFDGIQYRKDDFNVHWTEITCETDEKFAAILANIEKEMKRREKE